MPFYTSPRPTAPSRSDSRSSSSSVSVSSTGAIRETRPDGSERWTADTVEGEEELTDRAFGTTGSRVRRDRDC